MIFAWICYFSDMTCRFFKGNFAWMVLKKFPHCQFLSRGLLKCSQKTCIWHASSPARASQCGLLEWPAQGHHNPRRGCIWIGTTGLKLVASPLPLLMAAFSPFIKGGPPLTHLNLTVVHSPRAKIRTSSQRVIQTLAVSVEKMSDSSDWVANPSQFFAFNKIEEESDGVVSWSLKIIFDDRSPYSTTSSLESLKTWVMLL